MCHIGVLSHVLLIMAFSKRCWIFPYWHFLIKISLLGILVEKFMQYSFPFKIKWVLAGARHFTFWANRRKNTTPWKCLKWFCKLLRWYFSISYKTDWLLKHVDGPAADQEDQAVGALQVCTNFVVVIQILYFRVTYTLLGSLGHKPYLL